MQIYQGFSMNPKFKTATDFRSSLEARLRNIAVEKGEKLQRLRRKVAFDRFLARLFSAKEPNFFLKGGYAMELRLKTARATKDIDLTTLKRTEEGSDPLSITIVEELRELAKKDLNDFFSYRIGDSQIDLDNAPYGGARYPVTALLDGKIFERFQLDVGGDAIVTYVETLQGIDWLGFCGIPSPIFTIISIEQQFAEKLHAYTLPRQRANTRVKDIVDMVLLMKMRTLDIETVKSAIRVIFKVRATHPIPERLDAPPKAWEIPYHALAQECSLPLSLEDAFREVGKVYSLIQA
jgi:predicted nucleotidyltransferase component of viral defense system